MQRMCGRYDLSQTPGMLPTRFRVQDIPPFEPNDDVRPTDMAPVIFLQDGQRHCELMRWGLVPFWSKELKQTYPTFNARAETVDKLPTFREAFKQRHCLVPVDAFFEWPSIQGKKRKCRIAMADGSSFALAGLWEAWHDKANEDAAPVLSFTIITTAANEDMRPYHDRMPVIIDPEHDDWWLDAQAAHPHSLLVPYREGALSITPF